VEPPLGVGVVCLATDACVLPKRWVFSESGAAAEKLHEILGFCEPSVGWGFESVCSSTAPSNVGSEVDVDALVDE
jgi:hypothetical protein